VWVPVAHIMAPVHPLRSVIHLELSLFVLAIDQKVSVVHHAERMFNILDYSNHMCTIKPSMNLVEVEEYPSQELFASSTIYAIKFQFNGLSSHVESLRIDMSPLDNNRDYAST